MMKEHEPSYQELERRLTAIVQAIPHPMSLVSRDYRYLAVNDGYAALYQAPIENIVGRKVADFFGEPVFEETIRPHLDRCLAGETVRIESQFKFPDDSVRWMVMEYHPYRDEKGRVAGVISHGLDITEQRDVEERLKKTLDAATDGIWYWHFPSNQLTFGARYYTMLGYEPDEFPPTFDNWLDLIHPDDRDAALSVAEKYLETKPDLYQNDFRLRTKEGKYRWIHSRARVVERSPQGEAILMIGNHEDITERKRAEDALRQSEATLLAMFNSAPIAIVLIDGNGRVLNTNDEHAARFQLTRKEMIGICIWDVTPPSVLPTRKQQVEKVFDTGKPLSGEDRRGDVWSEYHINPAMWNDQGEVEAVIVIALDVTARKRGEEALRESERQKSLILDATSEVVAFLDLDLRVIWANRAAEESLGVLPGGLTGRQCYDIWAQRDDPCPNCPGLKPQCPGQSHELERRSPDGRLWFIRSYPVIDDGGNLVALAEFAQDISARKQNEERLRRSQAMLARTERIAHVGSWEWEIAGDAVTWSDELFRIHQIDPAKGAPRWAQHPELYDPEDIARLSRVVENAISDGTPYEIELRALTKDGKTRICLGRGFAEMGPEGRAVRLFGSVQDITEQKQAEEEREKLQAQLLQAQKMESVGRLAGGVAHDFSNMLQSILGYADLALMAMNKEQPVYADIEEIKNTAKRSTNIIRQLLAFARKQVIAPVVLDLNDQVAGMLKMLRRLVGEDMDLVWLPGGDVCMVRMDPSQIDQILVNLVVNARDAIQDVGQVSIETGNVALDEAYCADHPESVPGRYVKISVSDTGCGMDRETLHNIFEPFFTTKELGKGTGLGLATVYGIVKQNNGYIEVYSEPGKGAAFHIYLPRHEVEPEEGEEATATSAGPAVGTETVLLVEDQPSVLDMATRMLTHLGYTVLKAAAPKEAIRLAGEYAGEIHLLMTDVVMPGMNGRDLADRIRQTRPTIRFLYMSGYTADIIARQGVLEKGVQFIQKPFSLADLAQKVREAIGQ